jgi:hypothetical protein
MYYTIALLRYTSIEVLEVGGVADSLVKHVILREKPRGFVCSHLCIPENLGLIPHLSKKLLKSQIC